MSDPKATTCGLAPVEEHISTDVAKLSLHEQAEHLELHHSVPRKVATRSQDHSGHGSNPAGIALGLASPSARRSLKAARLIQAGLPWPAEEQIAHETRKLVISKQVPWHENEV
jgi:hypothetical protein